MPKGKENGERKTPAVKQKKANGYKFPDPIPSGFIVTDTKKKDWEIGNSIGKGGFAEVYSASECKKELSLKSKVKQPFAIKIEPKDNGPLFCEMHFYMKVGKPEEIEQWKKEKALKNFGMAPFLGSGSFTFKTQPYRFLVTERFGKSLYDIMSENDKHLPVDTSFQIAVQLIDLLEYIHDKGYIHGDIKSANLLLGLDTGTEHCIHIVDFGLAKKNKKEVEELPKDPKQAHNGTIEYISRDGHSGVFGRRGDLEMLGFNLLHWINITLPWEKDIANQNKVEQKKIEVMKSPSTYIQKNLPQTPAAVIKFLEYVNSLKNNGEPDYSHCRKLFISELSKSKCTPYGKLQFTAKIETSAKKGKAVKGKLDSKRQKEDAATDEGSPLKKLRTTPRRGKSRETFAEQSESDEELVNGVHENAAKKKLRTTPVKAKARGRKIAADDGGDNAEGGAAPVKSKRTKKKDEPTASWKNAPTVVASGVSKAGEYKKNAVPYSKRK